MSTPAGLNEFLTEPSPVAEGVPTPDGLESFIQSEQYGSPGHQVQSALEGAANTATFGLYNKAATAADEALGLDPSQHLKVREANPNAYMAGQVAGLASGLGAVKAGASVAKGVGSLVSHPLASAVVRGAVDTAIFQGGDEVSKLMLNDPNQSLETAAAHIGLAGLTGGALGGGGHLLSKALDATKASKLGQFAEDFKGRVGEYLKPVEATKEFNPNYVKFGSKADEPMFVDGLQKAELSFDKLSPGQKAADFFVEKALDKISGSTVAGGLGALAGGAVGHPYLGAALGTKVFGDTIGSSMHAIIKPLLEKAVNAPAFQAALAYGAAVAKGEAAISKATGNVFKASIEVLPQASLPNAKSRKKLEDLLDQSELNPMLMPSAGEHLGHYMPDHAASLGQLTATATNYLNTLKPKEGRMAPLDSKAVPTLAQKQAYEEALDIAQQPLIILNQVKNGNVSPQSLKAITAMYPALTAKLQRQLSQQMITSIAKHGSIPYKTSLGLSAFMGQALESSIMPYNMQMNQKVGQSQAQPQGMQPQPVKSKPEALQKLPSSYLTTSQARQLNRSSRTK